jgi:hypothetical protein
MTILLMNKFDMTYNVVICLHFTAIFAVSLKTLFKEQSSLVSIDFLINLDTTQPIISICLLQPWIRLVRRWRMCPSLSPTIALPISRFPIKHIFL